MMPGYIIFIPVHTDIDDCSSLPCLNGGTCVDQVNRYMCECTLSFSGVYCEIGAYSHMVDSTEEILSFTFVYKYK